MANRTGWATGRGQGIVSWGTLINTADMASMTNGQTVLSSVADIANGTNLDQFMDISYLLTIASSTIAAGANFAFWPYYLNQDGTHYGDNQFTAGTPASLTPAVPGVSSHAIPAVAGTTTMYGTITGIVLRPGAFRFAMQNNCGFALTAGTQTVKYETYNQDLNLA